MATFVNDTTVRAILNKERIGGVPLRILGGGVPPGSPNPEPYFRPKYVIFHARFQTRHLKSIPVFSSDF